MALIVTGPRWEDRDRTTNEQGVVSMTESWLVEIPDGDTTEYTMREIEAAPGVALYAEHPDTGSRRCLARSWSTKAFGGPMAWLVNITYTDAPFKADGGPPSSYDPENPPKPDRSNKTSAPLRPPVLSFSREEVKEAFDVDRDGDKVVNAAGDPFEGAETERSRAVITIKYFSSKLTLAHMLKFWDSVNQDAFYGFSSGTLRCVDFGYEWVYENVDGVTALCYSVTIVLKYNREGWGRTFLNLGRRAIPAGGGAPRACVDSTGQPVSDAVGLTVGGEQITDGSPPNTRTFHPFKAEKYSYIPASAGPPPVALQQGIFL